MPGKINPNRIWLGFFALWLVILSGAFSGWLHAPGLIQAWKMRSLRDERATLWAKLMDRQEKLESERVALESHSGTQESEIRRVLGWVGERDLVFDFSDVDENAASSSNLRKTPSHSK